MARMVATKAALSIRVDALTDADGKSEPTAATIGIENRSKLESRLRALEHQGDLAGVRSFSTPGKKQQKFEMIAPARVERFSEDGLGIVLDNGRKVEASAVILATGYGSSWDALFSRMCPLSSYVLAFLLKGMT